MNGMTFQPRGIVTHSCGWELETEFGLGRRVMCVAVKTRICLPRHYSFQWLEFSSDNFFPRAQRLAQYKQRFSPPDPFNGWAGYMLSIWLLLSLYLTRNFNSLKQDHCTRNSSDILCKHTWQSWSLTCRDLKGRGLLSPRQCPLCLPLLLTGGIIQDNVMSADVSWTQCVTTPLVNANHPSLIQRHLIWWP